VKPPGGGGVRPGRRITKILGLGPRKRNVLDALAGGDRAVLDGLIARGRVVMIGDRRGALYALTPK